MYFVYLWRYFLAQPTSLLKYLDSDWLILCCMFVPVRRCYATKNSRSIIKHENSPLLSTKLFLAYARWRGEKINTSCLVSNQFSFELDAESWLQFFLYSEKKKRNIFRWWNNFFLILIEKNLKKKVQQTDIIFPVKSAINGFKAIIE